MRNKKKVIGFGLSAIACGVCAVITGITGEVPDWLPAVLSAIGTACSAIGICFTVPNTSDITKRRLP